MCDCTCKCPPPELRIGDTLYGFCRGYFGRDSYHDKRIEAIGSDWVVVRYEGGGVDMFHGDLNTLKPFRQEPDEYGRYPSED